jgi:hypothetical protein
MEVTSIFEEYAVLEAEEKAIKAKKEQLRPFIIKSMAEQGVSKIETLVGKFSLGTRKVWSYPERIKELEQEFKKEKALSESTGEAICEEVEQLRFTQAKL